MSSFLHALQIRVDGDALVWLYGPLKLLLYWIFGHLVRQSKHGTWKEQYAYEFHPICLCWGSSLSLPTRGICECKSSVIVVRLVNISWSWPLLRSAGILMTTLSHDLPPHSWCNRFIALFMVSSRFVICGAEKLETKSSDFPILFHDLNLKYLKNGRYCCMLESIPTLRRLSSFCVQHRNRYVETAVNTGHRWRRRM